jgi:molecular chaperone HscB
MTSQPIPLRSVSGQADQAAECRTCGAGAPVDDHFCPQCSRILSLGRHGDYFAFLGVPRRLELDSQELERRFRDLSRKLHPDYFYNASPGERLASLERSSYLNDAFRALRNPVTRIEHLLAIEGVAPLKADSGHAAAPPSLLEEVFELSERLDEIREARESGADPATLTARLDEARRPIEARRAQHEARLSALCQAWDRLGREASQAERTPVLEALKECLLERNYVNNLMATIDRESGAHG